ncbi:DUF4232 domain-containing protein [Streptomyces griseoloalbus]|uniref:DUF4232 domain-containing protein n=1 Tax=Streptomyces griseoloalbus TaxID=67303 RepID=A0A7W8BS61_9ACTN|nr:DUF4232 domain-containing protein [Streptomyces albaduncus]MBB5128587.1 hypothetical protein [Streptomyces albaduncus]GGW47488.1 lipoprotein [Streptomyces albaduncus]
MRSTFLSLPAALTGVLLLTACGTEQADGPSAQPPPSGASCDGQPSHAPDPSLPGKAAEQEREAVRITGYGGGSRGCALFEVTHTGSEPHTYTVTFDFLSEAGAVLDNTERTVAGVEPGRTVSGRIELGESMAGPQNVSRVRIAKVRSVPADEAPSTTGPCPASGLRVYADDGDAAMGLRVVSVHLENCGTRPYSLHGYPDVQLLDEGHEPVDGVRILHDGGSVAGGTGADGPALPLVLEPGEGAWAGLVWRNTRQAGTPVNAPYVRVRAKSGADWVTVVPELDLGTTGQLGIGPWKKREEEPQDRPPSSP